MDQIKNSLVPPSIIPLREEEKDAPADTSSLNSLLTSELQESKLDELKELHACVHDAIQEMEENVVAAYTKTQPPKKHHIS